MAEQEVKSIVDKALEFSYGDTILGTIKAIKSGVLDNPFATNPASPCKVMMIKDNEGTIRYYGNLQFTNAIPEFYRDKITEREKKKHKKLNYDTLISDLMAVNKGVLVE